MRSGKRDVTHAEKIRAVLSNAVFIDVVGAFSPAVLFISVAKFPAVHLRFI